MLRDLNDYSIHQLMTHKMPLCLFFSADGSRMGFYDPTDLLLKKISLPDGVPEIISEHKINWPMGITWTQSDEIFYGSISDGLYKIPADRGPPARITQLNTESGERTHRWPSLLPDNQGLLFTIGDVEIKSYDEAKIAIFDFSTESIEILEGRGCHPRYIPGDYLCYSRDGKIIACRFDLKQKEIVGKPVMILDGVITSDVFGFGLYNSSRRGVLIYAPGDETAYHNKLTSINRKGSVEYLGLPESYYRALSLSPDGKKIALHVGGANDHIWIWDRKRKTSSPLTLINNNLVPIWMPDNLHVTFNTTRTNGGITTRNIKTKTDTRLFSSSTVNQNPSSWDSKGHHLLVTTNIFGGKNDIQIYSSNENKVFPFRNSKFDEKKPMFSPDGRWIAYVSDETGIDEVYVSSFPDTKSTTRVSVGGGTEPVWNPNGKELFYRRGKQFLSTKTNITQNTVNIGKHQVLFEIETKHVPLLRSYDYDAVNDRFIFISKQNIRELPEMRVIINWFDEVKNQLETKND
jgi:serine/threonine-protein kinase